MVTRAKISLRLLAAAASLWCCTRASAQRVRLAHEGSEWCSYTSVKGWSAAVTSSGALDVGDVYFVAGKITEIYKTSEAESGDWMVVDHYRVEPSGTLTGLVREIRMAEGGVWIRETYSIRNGKDQLTQRGRISPTTGSAVSGRIPDDLPEVPIATSMATLPFAALLRVADLRNQPRTCAPESPNPNQSRG